MKKISIDPITRLEGHGKIDIFLNDEGNVENAYLQIPELRGFEKFCEGRPAEELPRIVSRICGVCPEAHHLASTKALDAVWSVEPTPTAKKLRELMYCAHIIHSHTAHFYALAAPDFVLGPDAKPEERNILGVIAKVGLEIGKEVIKHRSYAQQIQAIIGGKATHPVCGLPGGMSKGLNEDERKDIEEKAKSCVKFAKLSLKIFEDVVLKNKSYVELIQGEVYRINTYFMGLVDENNKVNFYDGKVRVVDQEGKEFAKFDAQEYLDHIAEHVEPWTYLKFPYLKKVGWKGFVDGVDSGIYRVGPLARLNVADGMATPMAQEAYERMYETLGKKPVQATLAYHWARLVELMYAAERLLELAVDEAITSKDIRRLPTATPSEGVGIVEAPRGTLFHHYRTDANGMIEKVNLIVATGNNNAAMNMSVKKAAQELIKNGQVEQGLLNMVEMAFRAYDPCMACATHSLPGQMPLEIRIFDAEKTLCHKIIR
ncbi:coenzyme F420-reducing hydrogenase, alpha subunit [Calderihabitans maritimus]|uniref:Coenzyme F420-reducing hydrogenase, alpha subunit n=1 Tax=Calderihabitans maritimus TaxID=1246530 RepID=A0A1Z5HNM9_9FIRM|nr:coenzyme F420-reducing hydrogenase, alpha subunit [Calderihabitans maritimus]